MVVAKMYSVKNPKVSILSQNCQLKFSLSRNIKAYLSYMYFRLDGKNRSSTDGENGIKRVVVRRGVPDYDYKPGYLKFIRNNNKHKNNDVSKPQSITTYVLNITGPRSELFDLCCQMYVTR